MNKKAENNNQKFDFKSKVFKAPGAVFRLHGQEKKPMFGVEMGAGLAYISLSDLIKQFSIDEDSEDSELISIAANGLKYVPDIRPGDEIPQELLDGSASWHVEEHHKETAKMRIQAQLLSWLSGKEQVLTDPSEIQMFLDQVENKERIREAMREAASQLGFERDNTAPVIEMIETMARELSYIEALRERCSMVEIIDENLVKCLKLYDGDKMHKSEIQRMKVLLQMAIKEFRILFDNVDAQTGEIISALGSIDKMIDFIRKCRDELHFLCMEWDENFDKWQSLKRLVRHYDTEQILNHTYRLLASRYNTGKSMIA